MGGSADGRTGGPQLLNATRIAYRVAAAAPADGMNPFFCSVRGVTHGVSSLRQSLRRKNGPLCFVFRARLCVFLCVCVCVCVSARVARPTSCCVGEADEAEVVVDEDDTVERPIHFGRQRDRISRDMTRALQLMSCDGRRRRPRRRRPGNRRTRADAETGRKWTEFGRKTSFLYA